MHYSNDAIMRRTEGFVRQGRIAEYLASRRLRDEVVDFSANGPSLDDFRKICRDAAARINLKAKIEAFLENAGHSTRDESGGKKLRKFYKELWNHADYGPILKRAGLQGPTWRPFGDSAARKLQRIEMIANRHVDKLREAADAVAKRIALFEKRKTPTRRASKAHEDYVAKANKAMRPVPESFQVNFSPPAVHAIETPALRVASKEHPDGRATKKQVRFNPIVQIRKFSTTPAGSSGPSPFWNEYGEGDGKPSAKTRRRAAPHDLRPLAIPEGQGNGIVQLEYPSQGKFGNFDGV